MLVDFSETQDEMDKIAFSLDRNKFSRSSSFATGQKAETAETRDQVGIMFSILASVRCKSKKKTVLRNPSIRRQPDEYKQNVESNSGPSRTANPLSAQNGISAYANFEHAPIKCPAPPPILRFSPFLKAQI